MTLKDKTILVTGGSGSFGERFISTVLAHHGPAKVIVFSRDEYKQYRMAERFPDPRLRFFIGDVRDGERLRMAMREVDIVVHAAALKHVPIAEYNPIECTMTNIDGAKNVVSAALACGVGRVIALSTDKACNPINLYGATKLASDKIFIASNNLSGKMGTKFSVVRYGNVVDSRGSVIPAFRQRIRDNAEYLPITDPAMTRFWITLDQSVAFVVSALAMMRGGEMFVPKIPSMRIVDLARALAPDLPQRIVGIRAGEKLHEVMITEDDARQTYELADRYVVASLIAMPAARAHYQAIAKPVPPGFRYSSDTNACWISPHDLRRMIAAPTPSRDAP